MTWPIGVAAVLIVLVMVGIFYSKSQSSDQAALTSSSGFDVGGDVGDQVPGFDLRLVNGRTINSTALVSAERPAFYFFFATW
jgi:cytochrome oxidase Cu insertion factor (SCO1/SenC/PrrC family)